MSRFEKNPYRELPDGTISKVYPFHVSLEGLETKILCREESDYDAFVKIICVCAFRTSVILLIYAVVSNHAHCAILAPDQSAADAFAAEVKRMYSMYFSRKYSDRSVLKGVDASAVYLYSDYYLRNAIAYVPDADRLSQPYTARSLRDPPGLRTPRHSLSRSRESRG